MSDVWEFLYFFGLPSVLTVVWLVVWFWLERMPAWFLAVAVAGCLGCVAIAVLAAALDRPQADANLLGGGGWAEGLFWFGVANALTGLAAGAVLGVLTVLVNAAHGATQRLRSSG